MHEPGWDIAKGDAALLKYAVKNPRCCTLADVRQGGELIFGTHIKNARKMGHEISGQVGNKALFAYLRMEFSLTLLEMARLSALKCPRLAKCLLISTKTPLEAASAAIFCGRRGASRRFPCLV